MRIQHVGAASNADPATPTGAEAGRAEDAARLQIGEWTVEPSLNQISAAGSVVKLEPKAMAVLMHLASRPGQVVSRESLLSAVWSGVVVGDDSVTQVVIKLRKALGDVRAKPAYIQTIPKSGYRLVAPVVRPGEAAAAPPLDARAPDRNTRPRAWIVAAGAAALLAAGSAAWWMKRDPPTDVALDRKPVASLVTARATQPTVGVRAFEAMSNDPQEMLLARGITADLVTDLSKVFGLAVIDLARGMGRAGGDLPVDAPPIRYFVSGSVHRADDRLRLRVHLTDAESGLQLWSERFDRPLTGFFAIHEDVASKILHVLPAKVSEAELRRVAQRHTQNLEAYEYFQRGQSALLARQRAENETAREMFRRAIALDAAFARAYAGLAQTYAADYRNRWADAGAAALDRAFEMARTAHEINPDIPETYWVLAFVHLERRQHAQALDYLETAVRLYPSFADGYALMGGVHTYIGRPAETVPLMRAAMRLNPQGGYLYFLLLGRAYLFLGDLEQSRVNLEHALARNPANLETHIYLAALHAIAGDNAAAAWEADEIRTLQPDFSTRAWLETYPMTDAAQKAKLLAALGKQGF